MWNALKNAVERWPIAWLIAIALAILPMVNWIGVALSLVIVLRHGAAIGFLPVMTTGATLLLAMHGFFGPHGFHFDLPLTAWTGIGMIFIPLWACAVLLRSTRSLSLILQVLFVINFALIWISNGLWGTFTAEQWHAALMNTMVAPDMQASVIASEQNEYLKVMAQVLLYMWPAFVWFLQMLLIILARWIQSRLYNPGGFQQDFHQIRIARTITGIVVVGMLWAAFSPGDVVAEQWSTLGSLVLSIAGLAWVHWYVLFKKASVLWLYGLYLMIFAVGALVTPLLTLLGVVDSSLDLRTRLTKGKTTP